MTKLMRLTHLAASLAEAYSKTPWGNVEDDISLCAWVSKQTNGQTELKIGEAEMFRDLIDRASAAIRTAAEGSKVMIFVYGGVVQEVRSNDPRTQVIVIDRDNEDEESEAKMDADEALHPDCVHVVA